MEPTVSEFKKIFPEFSDTAKSRIEYYMSQAQNEISTTSFGDSYVHAVYLVTAHNLTISDPDRAANGATASEKAGDLAVTYKTTSGGNDPFQEYRQTNYGIQYITLVKSNVMTINVI